MKRYILFFLLLSFFSCPDIVFAEVEPADPPVLVRSWKLSPELNTAIPVDIDTGLLGFQITSPVFLKTISASWLGNKGLPALSDLFVDRVYFTDNPFISHFLYYFHSPSNFRFYNTKRPYTRVGFTTAGPQRRNEKIFSILHTQNINPDFNVGFLYDNISSDGQYQHQTAKINSLSLFSNLRRDRYLFHALASINNVQAFENGGLLNVEDLRRTDLGTQNLLVRLNNARTELKNSSIFFIQKFSLFGKDQKDTLKREFEPMTLSGIRIGHTFYYNRNRRAFTDNTSGATGFYPDFFIDSLETMDSLYFRSLRNDFFIELPELRIRRFSFGAHAGISQEFNKAGYSIFPDSTFVFDGLQPTDTIVKNFSKDSYSSYSVFGNAQTSLTERVILRASLKYYFAGYRQNDFDFKATGIFNIPLFKRDVILEPEIRQIFYTPSWFLQNFSSNHFIWSNNFRQVKKSSIGGRLIIPDIRFRVSAYLHLLNDYVFFNQQAIPEQNNSGIEVFTLTFDKDFEFWRFNLRSRIALQASTNNQVINFPEFISYHSLTFTQDLFKKALTIQAGIDVYYNSEYFVPAYQPATSQFYLQNEIKYGNYPYINGFLNFAIKRTRVFIKAEHVNSQFFNYNYFTVLNHPRNGLTTRFGLVWNFYD